MHAAARPDTAVSGSAVLIVLDESPDAHDIYGEYLQFCGFRVTTAREISEALRVARSQPPDVVVADMSAASPAAWNWIKEFKTDPVLSAVPIVAIAPFDGDDPPRPRDAGADVCLAKPCLPSQIARTIRVLLIARARL